VPKPGPLPEHGTEWGTGEVSGVPGVVKKLLQIKMVMGERGWTALIKKKAGTPSSVFVGKE